MWITKAFYGAFYRFVVVVLRLFSHKLDAVPPDAPAGAAYITHHQNMYGAYNVPLWFPIPVHNWIYAPFTAVKTAYHQYMTYTLTVKEGYGKIRSRMIAGPLALIVAGISKSGRYVPVYRGGTDSLKTIKTSVEYLKKGESILVSPDIDYLNNSALTGEIYEGFLLCERYYYRQTGKHLPFVPTYASKKLKKIICAPPIYFETEDFLAEQDVIAKRIVGELNRMAKECGDA